jgi:predicted DNA-binding protein
MNVERTKKAFTIRVDEEILYRIGLFAAHKHKSKNYYITFLLLEHIVKNDELYKALEAKRKK